MSHSFYLYFEKKKIKFNKYSPTKKNYNVDINPYINKRFRIIHLLQIFIYLIKLYMNKSTRLLKQSAKIQTLIFSPFICFLKN